LKKQKKRDGGKCVLIWTPHKDCKGRSRPGFLHASRSLAVARLPAQQYRRRVRRRAVFARPGARPPGSTAPKRVGLPAGAPRQDRLAVQELKVTFFWPFCTVNAPGFPDEAARAAWNSAPAAASMILGPCVQYCRRNLPRRTSTRILGQSGRGGRRWAGRGDRGRTAGAGGARARRWPPPRADRRPPLSAPRDPPREPSLGSCGIRCAARGSLVARGLRAGVRGRARAPAGRVHYNATHGRGRQHRQRALAGEPPLADAGAVPAARRARVLEAQGRAPLTRARLRARGAAGRTRDAASARTHHASDRPVRVPSRLLVPL